MATVPLLDDTIPFGEEDISRSSNFKLPHPYISFFHIFFRGSSIVVYMLCGWFSDSFITSFVFVVLLLSADFWMVKNISGRLLVGLRWWNYVDDDGVSHWVFEARKNNPNLPVQVSHAQESRIFWSALVLCPALWIIFFIIALFGLKLKWLVLVVIALILNGANLYGYIKCNFGNQDIGSATTDFVKSQVLRNAFDMMMTKPTAQPTTTRPTGVV